MVREGVGMTRVATGRLGDSSSGEPPTTQAVAPAKTPPSTSPEGTAPPTEDKDVADVASPDGCQRTAPEDPAQSAATVSDVVASWPATSPAEVEGIIAHEIRLAKAARGSSSALPPADAVGAVEAGMLADAVDLAASKAVKAATGDEERSAGPGDGSGAVPVGRGITVAAELGQAAVAVQRHGLPPTVADSVDWSPFGQVIPVLSGHRALGPRCSVRSSRTYCSWRRGARWWSIRPTRPAQGWPWRQCRRGRGVPGRTQRRGSAMRGALRQC